MPARDDYILRFLDLLRQAIAESVKLREGGRHEQAMFSLMVAQEKLFARPIAEFAGLPLDQQLRLLTINEPEPSARAKVLGYATLLREAGLIYTARSLNDQAQSAFQLALDVALSAVISGPPPDDNTVSLLRDLLARIPPEQLQAPVVEMLEKLDLGTRGGDQSAPL